MAHSSACRFFFMALCSSLLLHPAFARKGKHPHATTMPPNTTMAMASTTLPPSPAPLPASESLALIVASDEGKSFTKHICELSADPEKCTKILKSKDEKFLASLPPGTTTLLSIELSAAVSVKAVTYMTEKLTKNHVEPAATLVVTGCVGNYQEAIAAFNGAYANFTQDPVMASKSLHLADAKIGECENGLRLGGPSCSLPQIDETNKLLRRLVELVSKEMKH